MHIAKFVTAGGLLMALLVAVFVFGMRGCLSNYDERFSIAPVLYFKKEGTAILFSLVQFNETTSYSSEPGMTMKTFTNYYFVQCNNAVTGQKIIDSKIKERTGSKVVVAQMLGAAHGRAWLFVDGLVSFDPFTLKKMADAKMIEERNPALKGRLPAESQYYHFSNEEKNIRFTAIDGSLWLLDTQSLIAIPDEQAIKINTLSSVGINWASKLKSLQRLNIGFNQMAISQDTLNGQWIGLYAKDEMGRLNERVSFYPAYSQDARRQLYTGTFNELPQNNVVLNKAALQTRLPTRYFLDGGFLLNKETGSILRMANPGGYLVIHKSEVGSYNKIMISRISVNGSLFWTVDTWLGKWDDCNYQNQQLFISGNTKSASAGCNVLLLVDLVQGKINRYNYFTGKIDLPGAILQDKDN